jgi:molybdate transport system substrate-binding protein
MLYGINSSMQGSIPREFVMAATSLANAIALWAVGAVCVVAASDGAQAAELKVLISTALKAVMEELGPQFERTTEYKLAITFGPSASLKQQIEAGETFDLALITPASIDDLIKQGRIDAGSRSNIGRTGIGVAIRAGAAKPDIGTVAAFKRALLDAKSITYGDPARGGLSSVYFVSLLERLGIADQIKSKAKLGTASEGVRPVATGEAELGIGQTSEIPLVPGVELLGAFPAELQSYTNVTAGIATHAKEADGAKALIKFLNAPAAVPIFKAKGMEPG